MRLPEALQVLHEVERMFSRSGAQTAHVGTRDGRLFAVYFVRADGDFDRIDSTEEWAEIKRYLKLDRRDEGIA